jgi:hypothetical protein
VSIINYSAPRRLMVSARGHPYQRDAFAALFDSLEGFAWSLVEQPLAAQLLTPALREKVDACVFYDMPGVDFTAADAPRPVPPPAEFTRGFIELLEAGMGCVFMHHSIAAWPAWPEYAEIVGGRFHYRAAPLRGRDWPDSGYRHKVDHSIRVARDHPVTAGLPARFAMTDELYLCPLFEDDVIPLLRSDYEFIDENFYSARLAVAGEMYSREGWQHPPGANLVAWIKHYGNSPIVYIQGGDDVEAYDNPHFQRLLHNAVRWVASADAHCWARQQAQEESRP